MSYNDTILAEPGPSSQTVTPVEASFVRQFRLGGGTLSPRCKFVHYQTMGTGMVAGDTIKEGDLLFSIPRHMLLNIKTSILPHVLTSYESEMVEKGVEVGMQWEHVNIGWLGLMLTMMWERFRSSPVGSKAWKMFCQSNRHAKWLRIVEEDEEDLIPLSIEAEVENDPEGSHPTIGQEYRHGGRPRGRQDWGFYFDILPQQFDTPMFWNETDMQELKGTSILSKIGREEATKDYLEKVRPYIRQRANILFGSLLDGTRLEELIDEHYSLDQFHIMGSRILSRSFHVKDAKEGIYGEEGKEYDDREMKSEDGDDDDSDEEDDEEGLEDIEKVSMVPMADMLNARSGHDNAHLFYKQDRLEMRAIQTIEKGEMIWNTYGDPPSSDLLRRYGYVDLGNPADIVELNVTDLINACMVLEGQQDNEARRITLLDRIKWACSLGLDEEIPLTYPFPPSEEPPYGPVIVNPTEKELKEAASTLSDELLIHARILCMSESSFDKSKKKDKLPNPRIDAVEDHLYGEKDKMGIAELVNQAIEERKMAYLTSIKEDEELLYSGQQHLLSTNKRNAIIVRLSEKRILEETKKVIQGAMNHIDSKKREASLQNGGTLKKQKTKG